MRIREDRGIQWQQEKTANGQYGPEFELETKYSMRMGHLNHAQNAAYI